MQKINWFPGHMAKAIANLKAKKNTFDMLIEIVDARAANISSNKELLESFKLPVLTIALKEDLAEVANSKLLTISIKDKKYRSIVIKEIKKVLQPKINQKKSKGLINPQFNILVVGLPNVGKSSFINYLLGKKNLTVENKPGVTKKQVLVKVDNMLFLNDSPGILFKKIESIELGYILTLIGCVKKEVVPLEDVVKFGYEFYISNYFTAMKNKFNISQKLEFTKFIDHICKKYKFIHKNQQNDVDRAIGYLFNQFNLGGICKVNYEI